MSAAASANAPNQRRFELLIKPAGPACNLDCQYCFYLGKNALFSGTGAPRMNLATLETLTRQYLETSTSPEVTFAWQGGEPTLMGLDFFRQAVALQARYSQGRRVRNTLQTNGTLLDDAWAEFLAQNQFLTGLSIDGPAELHDGWRRDRQGQPTHAAVMHALALLRKHGVAFNTLTAVHRQNARDPQAVWQFLKETGSTYWQFIPIVERQPAGPAAAHELAHPPGSAGPGETATVTPWSVDPEDYGNFLTEIFDRWVRAEVGRIFVQQFDSALGSWLRANASLCLFAEHCGQCLVVEHNGEVFACDHYVQPEYRLGNLIETPLAQLIQSPVLAQFSQHKTESLPALCRRCPVRFACQGECPKNRFATTPAGEPGLNYLCAAYRKFFTHADPCLRVMAQFVLTGQPAARIMGLLAEDGPPPAS